MSYAFCRLRAAGRDFRSAYEALRRDNWRALAPARLWGAFGGLFGVASNELIVMAYGDTDGVDSALTSAAEVVSATVLRLEPTVRPSREAPRTREGLYVFRFFDIAHKDIDAIAALSAEAWPSFETAERYEAIPQGLFRQRDASAPTGRMLLCTWYDGLPSWQASRTPPADAAERFRRRHALTQGSIAYATRLLV